MVPFDRSQSTDVKQGKVGLGMAVRTQHDAISDFLPDFTFAAIGQRTKVEGKRLRTRIGVVPGECGQIARIAACAATSTRFLQQCELAFNATLLLPRVVLMTVVGVRVLAVQ